MSTDKFGHKLVAWYLSNHRKLPWRETKDPYKIWLSEIILQQTRVAQGLPYYEKFISHYPDISSFASASEKEILHLWQGLGYYSRARNMHAAAKAIVNQLGGKFPESYADLLQLKGIGDYTASAIASFAFDEQTPVVDGNVFRVLSRFYGIADDISSSASRKIFKEAAMASMPAGQAAAFNQAIMEFGATQCTPVSPKCVNCVVSDACYAYHQNAQARLPVKNKKTKIKERHIHYLVIKDGEALAMKERTGRDIWKGLFDFFTIETDNENRDWREALPIELKNQVPASRTGPFKHILTHQHLYLTFWTFHAAPQSLLPSNLRWYSKEELQDLPKPLPINMFINDFL